MIISPAPVPNQFRTAGGEVLKLTTVEIGVWDMTADLSKQVSIDPIDYDDIRIIFPVIMSDSGLTWRFGFYDLAGPYDSPFAIKGDTSPSNAVDLVQDVLSGDPSYNDTGVNRGYLHIWHII